MIRGVLFDWRGTLVADPPDAWWIAEALDRLGRDPALAPPFVDALEAAAALPEIAEQMQTLDCSAVSHRETTMLWFGRAGLDDELASVLYDLDFEAGHHPFFPDVAETFASLRALDVAIAVVSDIHFDLRPEFVAADLDQLVDSYVFSFEHGVQKPSAEIFRIAAESLGMGPDELLMVGDRASHDGGAVALGITTLLLPPLRTADRPRNLASVLAIVTSEGADRS